jgi:NAD(P)-dependent dehydrogenase (short-subunit alcohol dehydrogenase family)
MLRPDLLKGISVLVAGTTESVSLLGREIEKTCTELGARVHTCAPEIADDEAVADEVVAAAVAETGSLDLLIVDGASLFARGQAHAASASPEGARVALRLCLDATWNVTRAVVNYAFLPTEPSSPPTTGRIVYLAPGGRDRFGEHADAARAGLENLGRTCSTEWARHGITTVTIAPGQTTTASEVAALCAYLASPAGAYFSGCLLDLRGPY